MFVNENYQPKVIVCSLNLQHLIFSKNLVASDDESDDDDDKKKEDDDEGEVRIS